MKTKVIRHHSFFILAILTFLSGCQLTTSGEKKNILDEDLSIEEKEQSLEKDLSLEESNKDSDQELLLTEIEPTIEREYPAKEINENISSAQKIKDEKRILDFFSDFFKSDEEEEKNLKTEYVKKTDSINQKVIAPNEKKVETTSKEENREIFKQDKPKGEKRILDFFTKFFDSEDQKLQDKTTDEESVAENVQISEEINDSEEKKQKLDETEERGNLAANKLKKDKNEEENDLKKEAFNPEPDVTVSLQEIKIKEIVNEREAQDKVKNSSIQTSLNKRLEEKPTELTETIKLENAEKTNDLAFLNTRSSVYKKKKRSNNVIGLLLPLTGEKRSAGNLVLNTFRYSLVSNPKDIVFKIYDTRGTSYGAVEAAKKGKSDNVDTFIGPVFSDETLAVKNAFKGDARVKFFSLSPDLTNISRNVIVSGQNPKDQISCILDDIKNKDLKKILLIHHNDKYGEVVKKNLQESTNTFNLSNRVDLSFFTVYPEQNLNKDIMAISNFESRKLALKEKRQLIENDKSLTKFERKNELKKLERQLTLGVPFDSIIIASDGDKLTEILSHLAFYDINANNTFIYGTSLWEDTNKKDKVFENTFFVSNLKSKESSFVANFKDVFSRDPSSVSFHLFDLIDLVNDSKFYDIYPEDKIFFGEYTNSLLKSGYVKRETFIKKNKAGEAKNVFSCQLSEI